MNNKIFFLLFLTLLFLGVNCKDEPTKVQPTNPLALIIEDASCTEVWVKISLAQSESERTVTLKRNDSIIFSDLRLPATAGKPTSDTLVVDEGLLPNKTYTYTLAHDNWSVSAQAITMDTTSHNWTWEITTLGDGSSSSLYDVAIINDTLAYAVGEIYLKDSTGQYDPKPYNLVKWNGKKWELRRVTVNFRGNMITLPLECVFAFSPTNIWFVGSLPIHGDGQNWDIFDLRSMSGFENVSLSKAWGSSSSNIYFIGGQGSIVHYNGTTWQKIESGTTLPINDIWGAYNDKIKEYEILCIASKIGQNEGKKLLKIDQQFVTVLPDSGLPWSLNSLWFYPNKKYCIAGDGFYALRTIGPVWFRDISLPRIYKTGVRGNDVNDIFVVGAFGLLLHYNGFIWHYFDTIINSDVVFGHIEIKKNLAISVGFVGNRAVVAIGKR